MKTLIAATMTLALLTSLAAFIIAAEKPPRPSWDAMLLALSVGTVAGTAIALLWV